MALFETLSHKMEVTKEEQKEKKEEVKLAQWPVFPREVRQSPQDGPLLGWGLLDLSFVQGPLILFLFLSGSH